MAVLLRLIRWKNLIIILLCQLCVFFFLRESYCSFHFDFRIVFLFLSTVLIAASGYIINDYSDLKIDAVNKPESIVVSRYLSSRQTLLFYFIFNVVGVSLGFYLHYKLGIIDVIVAWLLWRYSVSFKYKLFIGNLIVAAMLALSLLVVDFPFKDIMRNWLIFYSSFAFLTGLIREIIKDVEDQEGDALYGCRTIPIVYGIYKTKIILNYLMLAMVGLLVFVIGYFCYWRDWMFVSYLSTFVLLPMVYTLWLSSKADTKKDFTNLSRLIKLTMVMGILSMGLRALNC
ncbi:MAG: geranylgeranylglycerol-phosphate geranylgeranyltransferase [Bacteroidetes bacterium]|nr:geranylgeranylglycerol-phosphate geranylgeranyltransferase [Bacteroidota bacterium]